MNGFCSAETVLKEGRKPVVVSLSSGLSRLLGEPRWRDVSGSGVGVEKVQSSSNKGLVIEAVEEAGVSSLRRRRKGKEGVGERRKDYDIRC